MSQILEDIILKLLVPDNNVLQQATAELHTVFRKPDIIQSLVQLLSTSANVQVRQYSAILLRRKISKQRQWKHQSLDIRNGLKQGLLQLIISEQEKAVKNSIAQIVGNIAKHELSKNQWPELLQFLNQLIMSNIDNDRELGMFTLNIIASTVAQQLQPHYLGLISLFSKTLQDSNIFVATRTIFTVTSLVPYIGSDEMNKFQSLIPQIMSVINNLLSINQADACEALDIFEELMESEVSVVVPHIKSLVAMCLEIAASPILEDQTRVKALSVVSRIIRLKKKSILKHNLVAPIVDTLFPIMCMPSPRDGNENSDHGIDLNCSTDEDDEDDDQSPVLFAPQVLDIMALHLPPEKLIPPLMKHLEPAFSSINTYPKKASYATIAVLAEGCSEYIRTKYLHTFLKLICKGMTDESVIVRNSALFALGQFAEYLQPEVSAFHSELMPIFHTYLTNMHSQLQQGKKDPPNLTGLFFALETFCENLDELLLPYLTPLMEQLLSFLASTNSIEAKELSISAMGAAANAAKEAMVPYFPQIIEHLKQFLMAGHTEATQPLLTQTIDTLGVFARTIGAATFYPMAHECLRLGLDLIANVNDPDLRRCVYGLFASVSTVLGAEMAPYMSTVINLMIESLLSTEGIVTHYDSKSEALSIFDDLDNPTSEEEDIGDDSDDDDNDDDDDDECLGHSVENAYLEEKEDTCVALRELALNTGAVFLPYFERCFLEVTKLVEHQASDVRKPAILALGQFCITLHKALLKNSTPEQQHALVTALKSLVPLLLTTCQEDTERYVVMSAFEVLTNLFNEIQDFMREDIILEEVVLLVNETFKHKLACQDESTDDDLDDQEAEYDGMLLEFAGELVPCMAKIMAPHKAVSCLETIIPCLIAKTKPKCSVSERSFSIGTLAETVAVLKQSGANGLAVILCPEFLRAMKDEENEVRSNAVYGLGVLVQNAKEVMLPQFPVFLQALSEMLVKESDIRARDNICSAVARLIMADSASVPLQQVLPVFLKCLPLQIDFEENTTVYSCIHGLYNKRLPEVFDCLPQILRIISSVITSPDLTEETKAQLTEVVLASYREFPKEFETLLSSMLPDAQNVMKSLVANPNLN